MQNMTNLKENFKQVARNKIECGYLDFAHKLGWRRPDGQPLINKKHFFSYIKTSEKDELDLQRDLYYLIYDRFKKGENDEIVNFVEQFMIDNNIEYYNQEKKKKYDRKKTGCFESIAFAIKTDVNKKIRKYTSNYHKWYIRERKTTGKVTGEQKKNYITEQERFLDSIVYCVDHPRMNETVGFCFPRMPIHETMEEQNKRLKKEIEMLRKEGFQMKPEYVTKRKQDELTEDDYIINNWSPTKKSKKIKGGENKCSNVCVPDNFPRVHLEGVTFNINDTCVNGPIVIGGDYHNYESDSNNSSYLPNKMQSGKCPRYLYEIEDEKKEIAGEEDKNIKSNKTQGSVEKKDDNESSNTKELDMEKNKNIQSMNESDSWECKHCDFKELESGDYCKNGNELDGVFCNTCKKEFVSTLSKNSELRKHQWKPGFGRNLVHACLKVYKCGLAYCNNCWLQKLINEDSNSGNSNRRKRSRR